MSQWNKRGGKHIERNGVKLLIEHDASIFKVEDSLIEEVWIIILVIISSQQKEVKDKTRK